MISYVTLGTNDLPRAIAFYDELLGAIGAKRLFELERGVAWGTSMATPSLAVLKPFDGQPATHGNGTMVAISVASPAQVAAMHALALSLGATDEGAPGPRGSGFHCGYVRDLDGNKLNFFCMAAA